MKQVTTAGTCPVCGGGSFVAKRTKKGVVAAGLLAPKRVRCVRCGESLRTGDAPAQPTSYEQDVREVMARATRYSVDPRQRDRAIAAGDPPPRHPRWATRRRIKSYLKKQAAWRERWADDSPTR